jgi:hypothetical protein
MHRNNTPNRWADASARRFIGRSNYSGSSVNHFNNLVKIVVLGMGSGADSPCRQFALIPARNKKCPCDDTPKWRPWNCLLFPAADQCADVSRSRPSDWHSPALILYIWPCPPPKKSSSSAAFQPPLVHCHYVAVRDADNDVLTLQLFTGLPPSFTARAIYSLTSSMDPSTFQ